MALSKLQLQNVCLLWFQGDTSKTCRYLVQDDLDYTKWQCIKKRPIEKAKMDKQIDAFVDACKLKGLNPRKQNVAMGDNCKGYPLLKLIEQGYDKP